MEQIVAVIPARGGSKGIPRKNIKLLAGKPLIAYSIEQALGSPGISRVIVSTEDSEIVQVAKDYGAEVILRPAALAQDTTGTEPVLEHVVEYLEGKSGQQVDWVMLLQATSPFRGDDDLEKAWQQLKKQDGDSLLSVCVDHNFLWQPQDNGYTAPLNYDYRNRPRRQQMRQYRENGSIYITRRDILMQQHCRLGENVVSYIMSSENSIEIDSLWDWWLAEQIVKFRKVNIDG